MKPDIPIYEGGLSQHQLVQVLDYINDYLHQDIKLADLAALLNMSQYHFCCLFKRSIADGESEQSRALLDELMEQTWKQVESMNL